MSFAGRPLVQAGATSRSSPIIVTGGEQANFPLSTRTIFILTALIVIVVIAWTVYSVNKIPITVTQQLVEPDVLDLSSLIDLDLDGTCCIPPSSVIPTAQWMYDPTAGYTFSTTKVTPAVVCQSLSGSAQTTCLNYVTGTDGNVKPLAHKGITTYYPFTVGPATSICASYAPIC